MRNLTCWGFFPREDKANEQRDAQGQVGQGFEQPGLVEGVPARGRGLELRNL